MPSLHIRHLTQNQFQKCNTEPLYIQLRKLHYTEYKTLHSIFKINLEKQPPELFSMKRCSCRFCKFHRKTSVLESPWKSPWSLFWKRLQTSSLKACNFIKKRLLKKHPQNVPKKRPQGDGTSPGRQIWTSLTNAFSLHYFLFYFTKCVPETLNG